MLRSSARCTTANHAVGIQLLWGQEKVWGAKRISKSSLMGIGHRTCGRKNRFWFLPRDAL